MVNRKISIAKIDTSRRLRPIDPAHAEVIAASVDEVGMKQPITVRPHPHRGEEGCAYEYDLVIGGHRLYGVDKFLHWESLEVGPHVVIEDLDDDQARLAEIDENLARHELNALDRAIFLSERKRLYLAINPEAAHGKAKKSKAQEKSQTLRLFSERFTKATAARVGLSERTVQLAIQLAEKLDPEAVAALRGTEIETNQRELIALAALDPLVQRQVASSIRQGQAKSTAKAMVSLGLSPAPPVCDPQAKLYATLLDAWTKANKVTRAQFLDAADLIYKPADAPPSKGGKK